jgi:hypothetical protein
MPEWASRLRDRLTDGLNEIGFRWRETMRWSAPVWKRPVVSWERAWPALPEAGRDRAEELARKYDLEAWPKLLTTLEVQENLYTLDLLDQHLPALPPGPGLDVGAKDGVLLPALRAAWPHPWDLIEIDAHRRHLDLSTRRASGERMASAFPDCRYIADSVETLTEQYSLVTWFLPFVHEGRLRAGGLPRRFFAPKRLFRQVVNRVEPGGALLVVNQGEGERDTQHALFKSAAMTTEDLGQLTSPLSPFKSARFGQLWRRV